MKVMLTDFSGSYGEQGFTQWLQERGKGDLQYVDFRSLEGTSCLCGAREDIISGLPERLPRLRWIDSGDYHYMTHLLALRETRPFHLLLLDHHPDNQASAFGAEVLSCGSWVRTMLEENPLLQGVLTVGPEGAPSAIPEAWIEARRGERVYLSLDKDIMGPQWARTGWTQGTHSLPQVLEMIALLLENTDVAAIDICGELPCGKGARGEDARINFETNIRLYEFFTNYNIN